MLDDEIARDVVKACIRIVGELTPSEIIRMQHKLKTLRIITDPQLEELRVRILDGLENLDQPFELNKEFLNGIENSTKVREVIAIVAEHSEPQN